MVKPDAQGSKPCITRPNLLRGGVALLGLGLGAAALRPFGALAAPGDRYEVVPVVFDDSLQQSIYVDKYGMALRHAVRTGVTGDLRYGQVIGASIDHGVCPMDAVTTRVAAEDTALDGTFTAWYERCGTDADGTPLDAEVCLHDVRLYKPLGTSFDGDMLLFGSAASDAYDSVLHFNSEFLDGSDPGYRAMNSVWESLRVRFTRHGTGDLAIGKLNFAMVDIDIYRSDQAEHAEGVRLDRGFDREIYVATDTDLIVDTEAGWITTRGPMVERTPQAQAVAIASPEFEITWRGSHCFTELFASMQPTPAKVRVSKEAARGDWL